MEKYKKIYKFETPAPAWNEDFELPDESYSVSGILVYFEYSIEIHKTATDTPSIMIYVNKIENRITLKIKTGQYLELLTHEIIKLLGSAKSKITENENGQNVPHLETTKVVLIHGNIADHNY